MVLKIERIFRTVMFLDITRCSTGATIDGCCFNGLYDEPHAVPWFSVVVSLGELPQGDPWADEPDIVEMESNSVIRINAESRM